LDQSIDFVHSLQYLLIRSTQTRPFSSCTCVLSVFPYVNRDFGRADLCPMRAQRREFRPLPRTVAEDATEHPTDAAILFHQMLWNSSALFLTFLTHVSLRFYVDVVLPGVKFPKKRWGYSCVSPFHARALFQRLVSLHVFLALTIEMVLSSSPVEQSSHDRISLYFSLSSFVVGIQTPSTRRPSLAS